MSEYLRLKEIIEQTFKMEFVSDDQRKAVFASIDDSEHGKRGGKKEPSEDYKKFMAIKKAPSITADVTTEQVNGDLRNIFSDVLPEIEQYKNVTLKLGNGQKVDLLAFRSSGKDGGIIHLYRGFHLNGKQPWVTEFKLNTKGRLQELGPRVAEMEWLAKSGNHNMIPERPLWER